MLRSTCPLVLGISVGLLILLKVFVYTDCYSFDSHDDANHAIPGLSVARDAIQHGELPTINFFNNFGVPLLGDALTYPFSLQSLTYWILDAHVAMTLNRFLVAILTVIGANVFFRIYLRPFPALVCAFLAFFNPVSFWYPVHQYQMAAPMFFLQLYLMNRFFSYRTPLSFFIFFASSCVTVLSVSINHVVLMAPFLLVFGFTKNRGKLDVATLAPAVALAGAASFSFPQFYDFFRSFAASGRVSEAVYDGILTDARELFLGVVLPPGDWIAYNYGAQLQVTTYFSAAVIIAIISGVVIKASRFFSWKMLGLFLCGPVPTLLAYFLYLKSGLLLSIPLLKSTDITRVFWFSIPFCYVYLGYFLSAARAGLLKGRGGYLLIIVLAAVLGAIRIIPESEHVSSLHSITLLAAIAGVAMIYNQNSKAVNQAGAALMVTAFVLSQIPVIVRVLGLNTGSCSGTQYSSPVTESDFVPAELVGLMKPGHRIATEIHTHKGHDLRVARYGVLGSDARGIVVNRQFGKSLEDDKLVTVDQVPYGYFFSRPWQTDKLTRLGIRYLVVPIPLDHELESQGWSRIGVSGGVSIYENPSKPTPFYMISDPADAPVFLRDYIIRGTQIELKLPTTGSDSTLVATIVDGGGFEVQVDGRSVELKSPKNGFLSIPIRVGDEKVEIRHRPYSWLYVAIGVAGALIICLLYVALLRRYGRISNLKH